MAGETALARQLKSLAVPQTSLLNQGKIRKSFLFDQRDAAALDRDLIFAYGTTGLEKLSKINPMFQKFEQNLFSVNYKDFERSVQTVKVNEMLDEKITEFLRMLSSYFLTRAAHEALEWLINRYHIHLYNVDALIESVLPHYNTSSFVRVVQLLNLNDPSSRWHWLLPVQKSGVHLEFSAVVNHFIADGGFRTFVCEMASNNMAVFKGNEAFAAPVISFSLLSIYSALGKKGSINDSMITFLLPYILKGLSSDMTKYIAATYLVVSRIIINVKLSEELVNLLLLKIFENIKIDLVQEAFELLLLIFQQQSIRKIPKELFKVLLSQKACMKHLIYLTENYEAASLSSVIVKATVTNLFRLLVPKKKNLKASKRKSKKLFGYCKQIELLSLDENTVVAYFNAVINSYSNCLKKNDVMNLTLKNAAMTLLKSLETRFPEGFDKAVDSYFKKKNDLNKKHICDLINQSVCSLKNKVLNNKKTTLVLGINHSNRKIRKTSVKYLLEQASSIEITEVKFVENSLSDRLSDDDCEVVAEVLTSPEVLVKFLEKRDILSKFELIFRREINPNSPWYPVQMTCLEMLCQHFAEEEDLANETFITLLPFIFPLSKATAPGFLCILKSKLGCILPIVQVLSIPHEVQFNGESVNDTKQLIQLNDDVVSSLEKYVRKLNDSSKSAFLTFMMEKGLKTNYPPLLTLFLFASAYAIVSESSLEKKCIWVESLLSFLDSFPYQDVHIDEFNTTIDEKTVIQRCVRLLWANSFPGLVIFHEFYKIVTLTKFDCPALASNPWLIKSDPLYYKAFKVLLLIFEFCVKQINQTESTNISSRIFAKNVKSLFAAFIESQFQSVECLFSFLSILWSNVFEDVPVVLQVQALKTAKNSINESNQDCFFKNDVLLNSLLKAASSPHFEIRKKSLSLLKFLLKCCTKTKCASKTLVEDVCENQEEISTDNAQLYVVLNNWLKPSFDLYDSQNPANSSILKNKCSILESFIKLLLSENTPDSMKNHLLLCMETSDSSTILFALIPLINSYLFRLQNDTNPSDLLFENLGLLLKKYTPNTSSCLLDKSAETETLFKCLQFVEQGESKHSPIILQTLPILTRIFFTAIPSVEVQRKILDILLTAYLKTDSEINTAIKKVLGKLSTYAYLILKDFESNKKPIQKTITLRDVKKSRTKEEISNEDLNVFESTPWKKITALLELIQNKSKLDKCTLLVPELFNLLNRTLNFDKESSIEYVRQLILSTIYNCCQLLGAEGLEERQFQVEFIVQCIRSSTNPKTHYQCLLLLNLAATMFPDYVLNNVMSIFTFMGSSLVRQDNSYSFQVISQTIEAIVPSLLKASKHRNEDDAMQVVSAVIRVFVDSLSDIPRHRQLPLFTKLITTLDPSQYLWVPLAQICDQYSSIFPEMTSKNTDEWKFSSTLEFAVSLQKQFSPAVQIDTCINLLSFVALLPDCKDSSGTESIQGPTEPFNVSNHSEQQLQVYKYNILSYINVWLSSQAFISQVAEMSPTALNKLEEKYEVLLEKVLNYLQYQQDQKVDRSHHSLLPILIELVGNVNSLLPCNLFIRVVQRLLKNSETIIQKKAIELLSFKLEQQEHVFKEEDNRMYLLKLLRPLLKIIRKQDDGFDKESSIVNKQTALYALHLLTKVIGSEHSDKFRKVLNIIIQLLSDNTSQELTVNALLCLAQLCDCMNVQVLPQLNTFMPIIVDLLASNNILDMNDCLILGIITALMSLVQNLGVFMSTYIPSLMTSACKLITKYLEVNKKVVHEKLLSFQMMLAKDIDLRILLTAVESSYSQISIEDPAAVIPLMKILEEKLTYCSYTDIEACSTQLQQFFVTMLDFRNLHFLKCSDSPRFIDSIELSIFSALKTFVMKVSVIHFQSFFKKIYLWATATEIKLQQRLYTFYGLTSELSKALKSLFVVVAKTFLKHAASELECNNSSKHKDAELGVKLFVQSQHLNNILDTLTNSFKNDDGRLLDKDSFEALLQPLVDQLENVGNDEEIYQERVNKHLGVCLAHCMAAVSDNALWKKLNYQILLKTRDDSPIVRFAAIQVIREVATVMGDNYLVLLPESIPFLAEVMEDESAEVEHECHSVIAEMEKILGEPIKKYF